MFIRLLINYSYLRLYLLPQLRPEQAGFVPGRGTREQILNLRQIIEKFKVCVPTYLYFIDYYKAFDCIRWQNLWTILTGMSAPHYLVSMQSESIQRGQAGLYTKPATV